MTFATQEESVYSGSPAELFKLELGTTAYYLTSAEEDVIIGSITYESLEVSHSGFVESGEAAKNELEFNLPVDHALATYLIQYIPSQEITLTVYRCHRSESPISVQPRWYGVATSWECSYPDFMITFAPADYEIDREMMPRRFGPDCQWTQYDDGCDLEPATFGSVLTVSSFSGVGITFTTSLPAPSPVASPDEHFKGGFVQITGPHGPERARILSHATTVVSLDRALPGLANGDSVLVVPSCRGDITRCEVYFNNVLRNLSAPNANMVNPFIGDGVEQSGDL